MFKSILVPMDGSQHSEQALATGLELSRLSGGNVTIVTVVLAYKDVHVPVVPKLEEQTLHRAESYLAPFLEAARAGGFLISGKVAHGDPAEEIVRVADEEQADAIVMSTHGMGRHARHALGSVALKVLQLANRPVLMLPIAESRQPR